MVVAGVGIVFAFLRGRAADERDGKVNLSFDLEPEAGHARRALTPAVRRPLSGQVQLKGHRQAHLLMRRHAHGHLAVVLFAHTSQYCRATPTE
jgi:hypothetical protein